MGMENPVFNLPSWACPRCRNAINVAMGVTPGATSAIRKGKIVVCGHCGCILRIGDSGIEPMKQEIFEKLAPPTKAMLKIAVDRINKINASRAAQ